MNDAHKNTEKARASRRLDKAELSLRATPAAKATFFEVLAMLGLAEREDPMVRAQLSLATGFMPVEYGDKEAASIRYRALMDVLKKRFPSYNGRQRRAVVRYFLQEIPPFVHQVAVEATDG